MQRGVRIACDVGSVRIGLAQSDPSGLLAMPLEAVRAGDDAFAQVAQIVRDTDAVEIVVGLPLSMDGSTGPAAERAQAWADVLVDLVDVPVVCVDERLTTVQAQRGLHAAGRTTKTSRAVIDSASAVVLLQAHLDAERARQARS